MDQETALKDRTDVQIYRILASPDEYRPEIVSAAENEFQIRSLDRRILVRYQEEFKLKRLSLSREPLSNFWKGMYLLFPWIYVQFLFLETYRYAGAYRKIREIKHWALLGILLWSLILLAGTGFRLLLGGR